MKYSRLIQTILMRLSTWGTVRCIRLREHEGEALIKNGTPSVHNVFAFNDARHGGGQGVVCTQKPPVTYPSISARSFSGSLIGLMLNFSTSTLSTLSERNAGSVGPR